MVSPGEPSSVIIILREHLTEYREYQKKDIPDQSVRSRKAHSMSRRVSRRNSNTNPDPVQQPPCIERYRLSSCRHAKKATEAVRLYSSKFPTCSNLVDNHNILYLSSLYYSNCVYNMLQELCGSAGESYSAGDWNSYTYVADMGWNCFMR